jgi:GNAT superfamily N-acetyltransferase
VRVRSIGWQTDLGLRRLEGAKIVERDDHLIVRTAENPTYRWGNFLLFYTPPQPGDAERWISLFEAAFPGAGYVAIGIDSPSGELGAIDGLYAAGLTAEIDTVMTASELRAPAREPPGTVFRQVLSDDDWRQTVELRLTVDEGNEVGYRDFLERQIQAVRDVCERGHGAWFGAFRDGEMLSSLAIFDAGAGVARFQNVDTRPAHRRQGLASNLLVAAGRYALTRLTASALVIAADPDYLAIKIYRSLGFREREHHVQLERLGASTGAPSR